MAIQLSVSARNARLDSIETVIGTAARLKIFSGSVPSDCAAADPSGLLATIVCPSDWLAAASSGSKAIAGGPWSVAASGAGTAASFRVYDSGSAACHIQGTVGEGTGDLQLDNTDLAAGQTVNITAFTLTDGNA
jgi:hypothetical protein